MRAWRVHELGDPSAMTLGDVPVPTPGEGQLLVKVRAAALNFPDVLMAMGTYQERPPLPYTPGIELCGKVAGTGQRVLGAPSGGTGAGVTAPAGGPEKVEFCRQLGADHVVDYPAEDFVPVVKEVTGGHGADIVYDPVGGDVFDKSRKCVAFEGRLLVVGFTSGRIPEAPANHVLVKNYSVVGLHWALYRRRDPALIARTHDELVRLATEGAVDPLVGQVLPLAE